MPEYPTSSENKGFFSHSYHRYPVRSLVEVPSRRRQIVSIECGKHPTLHFAAAELARHLRLATGKTLPIVSDRRSRRYEAAFRLSICDDVLCEHPRNLSPEDDYICVRPERNGYSLCGSNPRSVLFAVYRYLYELGFRWIRPGKRGTIVPKLRSPIGKSIHIVERASYRYRTVCIEGTASQQHVVDLIDWMAKHGMNSYLIQFDSGLHFWSRWYGHRNNPYIGPEVLDVERTYRITGKVVNELKKRGLRLERMGHGWTCAALDIPDEDWDKHSVRIAPRKRDFIALIDGKRTLFHGVPLNTNLCYSNPAVQGIVTNRIVAYAAAHPELTAVHFWLADGSNNHCECKNCQKASPADFYVHMLNELDAKLSRVGLSTKVVFLVYADLLWAPQQSRIKNQDRFILMFAPSTRSYLYSFADSDVDAEPIAEYARNRLRFPKRAATNVEFLKAWQKWFRGDSFDFDYHLIWACYYDPNMLTVARVLHKDIRTLHTIGLHGFNSCQVQRLSFPHNLLMEVMARTLWNKKASFRAIARSSFADAYGKDGASVLSFFEKMSELWEPFFDSVHLPQPDHKRIDTSLLNLARMRKLVTQLRPTGRRNLPRCLGAVRWSWVYLANYFDLLELLIPAYEAYLTCSADGRQKFEKVFDFLYRNEGLLHSALDVDAFVGVLQQRVREVETAKSIS